MSERQSHTNLWAGKLQEISLPDLEEAKKQLFSKMDAALPVVKKRNNWQWLLVLLLLLLIGVCNCPGIMKQNSTVGVEKDTSGGTAVLPVEKNKKENATELSRSRHIKQNSYSNQRIADKIKNKSPEEKATPVKEKSLVQHNSFPQDKTIVQPLVSTNTNLKMQMVSGTAYTRNEYRLTGKNRNYKIKSGKHISETTLQAQPDGKGVINKKRPVTILPEQNKANSVEEPASLTDSIHITPVVPKTTDSITIMQTDSTARNVKATKTAADSVKKATTEQSKKKWAFAIGFNQYIPTGSQQYTGFNSRGNKNIIGDYIPVPQIRYYVNDNLYLQLEAAFNSPQYTPELLLSHPIDSIQPNRFIFLKKMYYLRLPLSVHYSLLKNFYTGAGLQYAHLTNATGLYQVRGPGSVSTLKNLKSDTLYNLLHSNEWDVFADINYCWKDLNVGLRYNKAFGNFVDTTIPGIQHTKAANSSLQLYVRYIIWKRNKKNQRLNKLLR